MKQFIKEPFYNTAGMLYVEVILADIPCIRNGFLKSVQYCTNNRTLPPGIIKLDNKYCTNMYHFEDKC